MTFRLQKWSEPSAARSNREEVLTKELAAHIGDAAEKLERACKMQSSMKTLVRQIGCGPKTFNRVACAVTIGFAGFAMTAGPASALVTGADSALRQQLRQNNSITSINEIVVVRRGNVARRTAVVGPHGGVASRTVVRGGAIAAGAAIGFVTAATAAAWAGAPPAPNDCWYYTDPDRTQGYWDACPQ